MKLQTLSTDSTTPRPFFGGLANESTYNLSGTVRISTSTTSSERRTLL